MLRKFKKLIPQQIINLGKHYPTAFFANLKYGFPAKKLAVIGVTGTDGKTTTTNMIYQILKNAGKNVSMISTIKAVIGGQEYDTGFHVTSPDPLALQNYINQVKIAGSQYLVLEVTSQGLDQFRVWGVKFDIGVITNITQDHFDYHKTFDNYLKTKSRLIKAVRVAILYQEVLSLLLNKNPNRKFWTKGSVVTFGLHKNSNFNPQKFPFKLKLPGEFNILNGLAAAATAVNLQIPSKIIKQTLENFVPLSGRMEEVANDKGIKIIIDFAHTPNALANALTTLRKFTQKKVISVFGSAGDRDKLKRPLMGQASAKFADITVLTAEDPRFEDPEKIIDEIEKGATASGLKLNENLFREPDRKKAIKLAISLAKRGDLVAIFGKGHEKSMSFKGVESAWSDKQAILDLLDGK